MLQGVQAMQAGVAFPSSDLEMLARVALVGGVSPFATADAVSEVAAPDCICLAGHAPLSACRLAHPIVCSPCILILSTPNTAYMQTYPGEQF